MGQTQILIDADLIAYRSADKMDGKYYKIGDEYDKYKANLVALCEQNDLPIEGIEVCYKPQPWHKCERELRLQWTTIIERVCALCNIDVNATGSPFKVLGYLTGGKNFRKDLFPEYKVKRKEVRKPTHLVHARKYLVSSKGCVVAHGQEADDAIATQHVLASPIQEDWVTSGIYPSIICSVDKDFNTVPGWHYNWDRDELYFVNEVDAARFFYTQMLTGDTADGVKGVPRIGKVTAAKLLDHVTCVKEMEEVVLATYREKIKKDPDEYFLMTGRLLHLRREEGEMWESVILNEESKESNKESSEKETEVKQEDSQAGCKTTKCE